MLTQNKIENSDKAPKISVIMPTYNRASLLPFAIKSVLNQTFKNIELIIVNDASSDNTDEVARGFNDKRIVYIEYKEHKGLFGAINTGFDAARGDFIVILADDDEFLSDTAETIVSRFAELYSEGIKILWFDYIFAETGEYCGFGLKKECLVSFEDILCNKIAGDYFVVIDRLAIADNRLNQTLWNVDSSFALKLYRNNKVYYIPKVLGRTHLGYKRVRISSLESSLKHASIVILQEQIFLKEYGDELKTLCHKLYGQKRASLGFYQILNNEKKEGRRNILDSIKFHFSLSHCLIFFFSFILNGNQLKFLCLIFFKIKERKTNLFRKFRKPIIRSNS